MPQSSIVLKFNPDPCSIESRVDVTLPTSAQQTGQQGEQAARAYLLTRGWQIVAANWRPPAPLRGDLDLIAHDGREIVIVEVRTRRARSSVTAFERAYTSIGGRKRQQVIALAHAYMIAQHPATTPWRIDVIAVTFAANGAAQIDHTEAALDW